MKWLLHRRRRRSADWDRTPGAAILTQLVDPAEPDADLLAQIEARIDRETPPATVTSSKWLCRGKLGLGILLVAAVSAFLGSLAGPDRQQIVARPSPTAEWVPLGAVTLHGSALRAFVRGKCKGHTHFYISMHGVSVTESGPNSASGTILMQDGEKILMECIF